MNTLQGLHEVAERITNWVRERKMTEAVVGALVMTLFDAGIAGVFIEQNERVDAADVACAVDDCMSFETTMPTSTLPVLSEAAPPPAPETTTTIISLATTTTLPPPPPSSTTSTTSTSLAPVEAPAVVPDNKAASHTRGAIGADQSYPNCSVPLRQDVTFGIVGVNDGAPFETNRCFMEIITRFRNKGIEPTLYVNTSLNWDRAQQENDPQVFCPSNVHPDVCPAYRWGYRAGQYAVQAAWGFGVSSRVWSLDVETANSWVKQAEGAGYADLNRLSLEGTIDALRIEAARNEGIDPSEIILMIYSHGSAWRAITNNMPLPNLPVWYATKKPESELLAYCDDPLYNLTGGGVLMVQTVDETNLGGHLDIDVHC